MLLLFGMGVVSAFASVDSGLIALIPAKSKMVAGIDVQLCRSSDFGQFLLSRSQANDPHFEQFMNQIGFDPRHDLESLVLTTSSDLDSKNSSFAILARGNFDEAKIRSLALSKGAVATSYQGVGLLVHKDEDQRVAFGFVDTGLAVMGDLASVHLVIDNLSTPAALDVDLTDRIQSIGPANDAWFVSTVGGLVLGREFATHSGGQFDAQSQALQSIKAANGGLKFGTQVTVTFDAATRSEKDAGSLADVVRFVTSMVQMNRQSDPRAGIIANSLDSIQLATSGAFVHIGLKITEKNLEQMADFGPAHGR